MGGCMWVAKKKSGQKQMKIGQDARKGELVKEVEEEQYFILF